MHPFSPTISPQHLPSVKLLGRVADRDQPHVDRFAFPNILELSGNPLLENTVSAFLENKVKIFALVDTGASHSVISLPQLRRVRPHAPLSPPPFSSAHTADGSAMQVLGEITLNITLGRLHSRVKVLVVPQLSQDLILGRPFLQQHKAQIDFSKNRLVLHRQFPLTTRADLTIPANTEVVCLAYISSKVQLPNGIQGEVVRPRMKANQAHVVAGSIGLTSQNAVPIRLYNFSSQEITIPSHATIASFIPATRDTCPVNDYPTPQPPVPHSHPNPSHHSPPPPAVKYNIDRANLSPEELAKVENLLAEYSDIFAENCQGKIGLTNLGTHTIPIRSDARPVTRRPYRSSPEIQAEINRQVDKLVDQDILEPCDQGVWSSPVLLVAKKDGSKRFVLDFRAVNAQLNVPHLRTAHLEECLDQIGTGNPKYFTSLDMTSGYFQVGLDESSREYTGFLTSRGRYRYKRLIQGLGSSSFCFQQLMDRLLRSLEHEHVLSYLDDIAASSGTFEHHFNTVREIFRRIRKANLTLSATKSKFFASTLDFLGHTLTPKGIRPDARKTHIIENFPVPRNVKAVRSFTGLCGFFRKYVQDFSLIAAPLYNLTKKDNGPFCWTPECQTAFQTLKDRLVTRPILQFPDWNRPFHIATDASQLGIGAVLFQPDPETNHMQPVAYAGRSFSRAEKNYEVTRQELVALAWGIHHFDCYLRGKPFHAYTDHAPITGLLKKRDLSGQLARLVLSLQAYQFDLHYIPGTKNTVPDFLSRVNYDRLRTLADETIDSFPDLPNVDPELLDHPPPCPLPDRSCLDASTQTDQQPTPSPNTPPFDCSTPSQPFVPIIVSGGRSIYGPPKCLSGSLCRPGPENGRRDCRRLRRKVWSRGISQKATQGDRPGSHTGPEK